MNGNKRVIRPWIGLHRFFLDPSRIADGEIGFDEAASHQIAKVLRLRSGQQVVVLDDTGWEYRVELATVHASEATGRVLESRVSNGEPDVQITLYPALLKSQKFELAIQKSVELGVSRFVPVSCERTVVSVREPGREQSKLERWRRIIREAAEQAERGLLPPLEPPHSFGDACDRVSGPAIILWEQETDASLKQVLLTLQDRYGDLACLSVFVGPEGGYTEAEYSHAAARGIVPVTLGPRVLRAETAAMAVVAAVMYHLGELGG